DADMARVLAMAPSRAELLARADRGSELVLTAAASAIARLGKLPEDAAVVVATYSASLEVNEIFDQRRRAGRPVEPRRFPATSPNLGAGLCTIAFELHGPSFAISCEQSLGPAALEIAAQVVAVDASAALLVFVEDVGAVVQDLLRSAGQPERPRVARALVLERGSETVSTEPFWERWPAE
ncbi:MAG TPA: beta-ketoacyl synthase N-terminal-like domain-containing protein, partial [Polyangiaceae bacterium]|nr:beta-ketoacyl synthase N-terminal-like domain-containing protein [Polyangiaceae bacterium]